MLYRNFEKRVTLVTLSVSQMAQKAQIFRGLESVNAGVEIPISRITRICEAEDVEFIPNSDFDVKDYYAEMDSAA